MEHYDSLNISSLNGLTTADIATLHTVDLSALTPASIGAIGSGYTLASGPSGSINWQTPNVWTTTGTASAVGAPMTLHQRGLVELQGEDADININGKSMKSWMEKVEERLNILTPNPELEKDWDDLRKLGERYRRLEIGRAHV